MTATSRAGALAFVTAAVALFTQVLAHRLISTKLVNNYAFLVISVTMLGFAFSGVVLSRYRKAMLERLGELAPACAALFVLTLLPAAHVFSRGDADVVSQFAQSRTAFFVLMLRFAPAALLFAVPFAFCGVVLGVLLAAPDLSTRRIYFLDLLGSALGALAVIPAISRLGVEPCLLLGCLALLAASLLLYPPRALSTRILSGAALALVAAAWVWPERAFPPPRGVEHVAWDPVARIEVSKITPPEPDGQAYPSLTGSNRDFLARFERALTQNNYAYMLAVRYDGRPESLAGIEETLYSAAYQARSVTHPRVAVVGVGGGFDVLTALRFEAAAVTGVEVNAATLRILSDSYREYFRPWLGDPRVRLVHGDGRHVLARSADRFDVIQLSGVDSYSGTPGAAHVFSESYLYTAEAFDLYLSRLSEQGILNVMRLEYRPPREMLRALVSVVASLRRAGVKRPADQIVTLTATQENFTALLVKRSPLMEAELDRLAAWAGASPHFRISAEPRTRGQRENLYQLFLSLDDPTRERAFVAAYPFDIAPAEDNRPFFFRHSRWSHLLPRDPVTSASVPVMELSLVVLTVVISLAVIACIYLPLRHLAARGIAVPGAWRYGACCAGIGLGYLAVEIALMQKLGLFLGHPNYALSVVLAALLLTTGVGSLFSTAILARLGSIRAVSYALAGLVLALVELALPRLPALIGLPFGVRAAIAGVLVAPLGVCLGVFFPTILDELKHTAPGFVPWAWGLNGIFSVLAPVLCVGVSMTWGIDALLLAAVPLYLASALVLPSAPTVASAAGISGPGASPS